MVTEIGQDIVLSIKNYKVQIWYRYNQEKDFEIYEVTAECDNSAKRKALDKHKIGIPFKTEII